jgi:copper(I)-binding protein
MKLRSPLIIVALTLVLGACGTPTTAGTSAPAGSVGAISVTDVWSRPALGLTDAQPTDAALGAIDGPTGVVYMTIRNSGSTPDRLLSTQSPVASGSELHTSLDSYGVISMRPLASLDIPAGGTVTLKPGGSHIMLVGLKRDLRLDDSFDVVLRFERAGALTVQSHVR